MDIFLLSERRTYRNAQVHIKMDVYSWKLTGEATSSSLTPHVDACSWKLTGEANSYSTLWLTGELMKLTQMDTTSLKLTGRP